MWKLPGVEIDERIHLLIQVVVSETRGARREVRLFVSSVAQGAPCNCS